MKQNKLLFCSAILLAFSGNVFADNVSPATPAFETEKPSLADEALFDLKADLNLEEAISKVSEESKLSYIAGNPLNQSSIFQHQAPYVFARFSPTLEDGILEEKPVQQDNASQESPEGRTNPDRSITISNT